MKQSEFPSLSLTKRLPKEICNSGYGYAEWQGINGVGDTHTQTEFTSKESFYDLRKRKAEGGKWMYLGWIFIECPSVMEMLDIMPKEIIKDKCHTYKIAIFHAKNEYYIDYDLYDEDEKNYLVLHRTKGNFPNALAEIILWLFENNYISFTK